MDYKIRYTALKGKYINDFLDWKNGFYNDAYTFLYNNEFYTETEMLDIYIKEKINL